MKTDAATSLTPLKAAIVRLSVRGVLGAVLAFGIARLLEAVDEHLGIAADAVGDVLPHREMREQG